MKTAMQELINAIDAECKASGMIINWDMYIEKEKQQIIDACDAGYDNPMLTGEDYYNQTYNHD